VPAPRIVPCPQCGKPVEWTPASRFRPFCSERCKMIDLGAWATGAYRIPTEEGPDEGEVRGGGEPTTER
jgi:endogenous inhibitor of DNA gyrase (YacG/DUF329 family)